MGEPSAGNSVVGSEPSTMYGPLSHAMSQCASPLPVENVALYTVRGVILG